MASLTSTRVKTGIEGLDDVLAGGVPRNRLYLLQGDPGVGKTTVALQFLLEGARLGEKTLYVTLSETTEELHAVAASHNRSLEDIEIYEMGTAEIGGTLDEENTLYVPAEVELGERVQALLAQVDRVKPSRVVLDSCSEMRLLAQTQLRFRRQIVALKDYLVRRSCTILLLDNPLAPGGDILLQSLVHGVIEMEQLSPLYGAERRRIRVRKLREVQFRGGYHDMAITTGGVVVYPRLIAAEHRHEIEQEQVPSGVPELDALLGGGLERGTGTLIMGPAGTGKSSVAARYAMALAERGERVAMFAFDEGVETLLARSAALGMDLKGQVNSGNILLQQIDPAELSQGEFAHVVRDAVARKQVRMVVIDSLNGYLHAMSQEQMLIVQLHELLAYLRQQGTLTLMVLAQHGFLGSTMGSPIDVSYLADTVVLTRYFEVAGRVRKAISVVKKRGSRHEDTIREFMLGPGGLVVGPPLESFRGVLTGVPIFEDQARASSYLLEKPRG
jgi:circadian clock protein KaiC